MPNAAKPRGGPRSWTAILAAPVGRAEFLGWCVLAAAVLVLRLFALGGPAMENDSYQYLSVAANFAKGHPASTSIVHFDSERSHGQIPAPMTTFPSGYPAAVAAFASAGLPPETAAVAVSAAAVLLLLGLYRLAARRLELGGLGTRFLFLWTFANAEVLTFGTFILTEALFTLLATGAVLLLAAGTADRPEADGAWPPLLAAGALIGLAYWVRYAGLFLYIAAVAYLGFLLLRGRRRAALRGAAAMLVATGIIALGLLRNVLQVGDWKGGNEKVVHHALSGVLVDFVAAIVRLFSGNGLSAGVLLPDLLLGAGLVLLAGIAFGGRAAWKPRRAALLAAALCFIGLYCAAMIHMGQASVITFGIRMFFPLLPSCLLVLALLVTQAQERLAPARQGLFTAGLLLASAAYVGLNVRGLLRQHPEPAPHLVARAALQQEVGPGRTLEAWIGEHVRPDEVIVATQGQATAYALHRPTLSLVSLSYSKQRWDEAAVKAAMRGYHATYLLLYAGERPELFQSPFLEALQAGTCPSWLAPAAATRDVRVYRAEFD